MVIPIFGVDDRERYGGGGGGGEEDGLAIVGAVLAVSEVIE